MDATIYSIVKRHGDLEEQISRILDVVKPVDSVEVMAYLLRRTMDIFRETSSVHCCLLDRMPPEVISRFAPGLLSFYFCLLKDEKTKASAREAAMSATRRVLEQGSWLDSASETRIHDFFYFNRRAEFKDIYAVCMRRFKTAKRAFFVSELIVLGQDESR